MRLQVQPRSVGGGGARPHGAHRSPMLRVIASGGRARVGDVCCASAGPCSGGSQCYSLHRSPAPGRSVGPLGRPLPGQSWAPMLHPGTQRVRGGFALSATPESGGGDGGSTGGGGDGDGDGGDGNGDDDEEDDPVLSVKEVEAFMKDKPTKLPADMMQTAQAHGLRKSAIMAFLASQSFFFTGWLCRTIPFFRDRILSDPRFLFKVGAEVAIDSGCATVAEVRKRGDDFWKELELYLSDLVVGLIMDVVMVSLMAPAMVVGGASMVAKASGLQKFLSSIPSAVFEASIPGVKSYALWQRLMCVLVKFGEYSLAGIACGFLGQGIANTLMEARRKNAGPDDHTEHIPVPPLFRTALVWGLFMGVSSNLRYQVVFGIERLVDITLAKNIPALAYITTLIVRFGNNVIGGENFIDMARWAGVQ